MKRAHLSSNGCLSNTDKIQTTCSLLSSEDNTDEDGPVVYLANVLDSRLRGDKVPRGSNPKKILRQ